MLRSDKQNVCHPQTPLEKKPAGHGCQTGKRTSILSLSSPVYKQFLGKRRLSGKASLGVMDGIIGMGYNVKQSPILEHLNSIPGSNGVFLPERRRDDDLAFIENLY
jgi:hypothetical protein